MRKLRPKPNVKRDWYVKWEVNGVYVCSKIALQSMLAEYSLVVNGIVK